MATNEETNAAGTDTRPPMLVENDYESWKIRIHRLLISQVVFPKAVSPNQQPAHDFLTQGLHATVYDDKALLMEAKEKGDVLDAEAEAFLADVECTAPYDQPTALTNNKHVSTNHEDAYDSAVDEGPILLLLSWPLVNHEIHQDERLDSDAETEIMTIRSRNIMNLLDSSKPKMFQLRDYQRNKPYAELVQENDLLKSTLSGKEKSIAFLQSEKEKIFSEKKDLADSYLDEIVCLKNANKVARDMLQRFNMPTQTIPMLSKKPKAATADLHKDLLGTRNQVLVIGQRAQLMKKMNEKPGHVRPENGFYEKLNALKFVPQKELSGDQAYWLSANEIASQANLRSAYDREHTKVLELEAEISKQKQLSAFTAENTKLKAQVTGTTSSGPSTSETPKVLLQGMTSNRPTQKPPVQQNKKPNVPVNLSTRTKPATESRKPMPKSHTWNHHILPNKSVNARRAAYHNRKLNVVDHNQFVIVLEGL
ncbi:hypothetical protein Tco_0605476 [Tanacetum coccineum]